MPPCSPAALRLLEVAAGGDERLGAAPRRRRRGPAARPRARSSSTSGTESTRVTVPAAIRRSRGARRARDPAARYASTAAARGGADGRARASPGRAPRPRPAPRPPTPPAAFEHDSITTPAVATPTHTTAATTGVVMLSRWTAAVASEVGRRPSWGGAGTRLAPARPSGGEVWPRQGHGPEAGAAARRAPDGRMAAGGTVAPVPVPTWRSCTPSDSPPGSTRSAWRRRAVPRTRRHLEERKAAGLHGGMEFTYRTRPRSTDPAPRCRGAGPGRRRPRLPPTDATGARRPAGRVARYAWDRPLRAAARRRCGAVARRLRGRRLAGPRACADDNALVDREAAYRAGLGWFGKNANLLLPGRGQLVRARLGASPTRRCRRRRRPVADGCGSCRRCLDGCPTGRHRRARRGRRPPLPGLAGAAPRRRSRSSTAWRSATASTAATTARRSARRTARAARRRPTAGSADDGRVDAVGRRCSTCSRPPTTSCSTATAAGTSPDASRAGCGATRSSCWATSATATIPASRRLLGALAARRRADARCCGEHAGWARDRVAAGPSTATVLRRRRWRRLGESVRHLLVTNDFPPKVGGIQSYLWELWRRLPPDEFAVLTTPYAGAAEWDRAAAVPRSSAPASRCCCPRPACAAGSTAGRRGRRRRSWCSTRRCRSASSARRSTAPTASSARRRGHGARPPARAAGRCSARCCAGAGLVVAAGGYPAAEAERAAGAALPDRRSSRPGVDIDRFRPLDAAERADGRAALRPARRRRRSSSASAGWCRARASTS